MPATRDRRYPYRCNECGFANLDPDLYPHCDSPTCHWARCPVCRAVCGMITVAGKLKLVHFSVPKS